MSARTWMTAAMLAAGAFVLRPAAPAVSARPAEVQDQHHHARRPDGAGGHGLQLRHRAGARRPADLQLTRGTANLRFMDIAATVNPATVHFRSLTEPSRVSVLEQNYEYDLLEPDKLLRKYVGRDVTLVRRRQEGGTTREEEVKARLLSYNSAPGVEDRRRDRHRHAAPITSASPNCPTACISRPTLIWTLENERRRRASRRGLVPGRQAGLERRLRADRGARRQGGRRRRLGDAVERQRHVVPQRQAAARGRRPEPRAPAAGQDGDGRDAPTCARPLRRRRWRRKRSPTITSTRWAGRRPSTTTRPSR